MTEEEKQLIENFFIEDDDTPTSWCEFCGTPDTELCGPSCKSWERDE